MSEKRTPSQRIADELLANEKLPVPLHKLNALLGLLGQLGWSIASQDYKDRETFHVYGPTKEELSEEFISNIQLQNKLQQKNRIHYLHQSDDLIIWRTEEKIENPGTVPLSKRESEIYNLLLAEDKRGQSNTLDIPAH